MGTHPIFESDFDCLTGMSKYQWGVLGGGQMGYAIIAGAINAGVLEGKNVIVGDPFRTKEKREKWLALGATCLTKNEEVMTQSKYLLLSVKPQMMKEVKDVLANMKSDQTVVSVVAGCSIEMLNEFCGNAKVVRVMLNQACLIGHGAAVLCPDKNVPKSDFEMIEKMFKATNGTVDIVLERSMDAFTALSGSGIAFVYQFLEALSDGGVHCGLSRELSQKVAVQTVLGAAKMVEETGKHPGELKDAVTSPSGTTIAGIRALEKAGFRSAAIEAVIAATERCKELS